MNTEQKSNYDKYQKEYKNKNKEKLLNDVKEYYHKNKEKRLEYAKQYREVHRKLLSKKASKYFQEHKQKVYESRHTDSFRKKNRVFGKIRRARKRAASIGDNFTVNEWKTLLERFENRCAYCRKEFINKLEPDHVIPISRGGTNSISNILPCCRSCNAKKGAKLLEEWIQ
jgi:5-methylcytosine-specific restriction endonuclease McrA